MKDIIAFAQTIAIPMQIVGADGQPLYTNTAFNHALGLPDGHDWQQAVAVTPEIAETSRETYSQALSHVIRTGEVQDCELVLEQPSSMEAGFSGRNRISVRISPFAARENEGDGHSCVVLLCPEKRRDQQDESELLRIQRGENLQRLASGVAHEFNNLFTGISGLTELIKSEVDHSSETFEFAQAIQETVDRGSRLIQQLSSFARDEPYSLVLTNISNYMKRSLPLLEIQLEHGITLVSDIRAECKVMLDSTRMDHALSNLLHNSRDALDGKGRVRITVEHRAPNRAGSVEAAGNADDWLMIEVADSGPGIPDSMHEQVIRPFFTTKEAGKATGLGLPSTVKIIEMHNGVVQISGSADLGGAAVQLFLPVVQA